MVRVIFSVVLWLSYASLSYSSSINSNIPSIVEVRFGALTDNEVSGFSVLGSRLYYSKLAEMWNTGNRLKDDSEVFIAVSKGKVVGFIVFSMKQRDDNIDNVVVAKNEQGKGVG